MSEQVTYWQARLAQVVAADGEDWDRLSETYDADWKAAYKAAFVEHALSRPGWDRENAELAADDIAADALCACAHKDASPTDVAKIDVIECERDSANA